MKGEKREKGLRWSSRERAQERENVLFVGVLQMNASMHRHACLYRVNTYVLVECAKG